jgi:hypothetical protein
MCYFIGIGLPPPAAGRLLEEFGRGYMLSPTSNASIRAGLPASFHPRLLTSGMCSCDLYHRPGVPSPEPSPERMRDRYRKRGWSEAKIDRAISRSRASPRAARSGFSGLRADVAAGILAVARDAGPLALVVHCYSGEVESERFAVTPGPRYRGADFLAAAGSLPADTLVWVEGP